LFALAFAAFEHGRDALGLRHVERKYTNPFRTGQNVFARRSHGDRRLREPISGHPWAPDFMFMFGIEPDRAGEVVSML
jgi:hypothetical protein